MPYICYVPGCENGSNRFLPPAQHLLTKEGRKQDFLNKIKEKEAETAHGGEEEKGCGGGDGDGDEDDEEIHPKIRQESKGDGEERKWHCFKVPFKATEEVRSVWKRNIPKRPDEPFNFKKHTICNLHFDKEYVLTEDKIVIGGEVMYIPKTYARLRVDAIPTKFPGGVVKSKVIRAKRRPSGVDGGSKKKAGGETGAEEYFFEDPMFKKEYYCGFCLKSWMSRIVSSIHIRKKAEIFDKFLRFLTKYANLPGVKCDTKTLFEDSADGKGLLGFQENYKTRRCESIAVCGSCSKKMEGICGILEELEVMRMKVNAGISELRGVLGNREEMRGREEMFGKWVGQEKLEKVKVCHDVVKRIDEKLLQPKVRLESMDPIKTRQSSDEQTEKSGAFAELPEYVPPPIPNIFVGSSQILDCLGIVKPGRILSCRSCSKSFDSSEALQEHHESYHATRVRTATTSFEQVEDDENVESSISAPGTPMTVDVSDDDDVQELPEMEQEVELPVPSLVLVGGGEMLDNGDHVIGSDSLKQATDTVTLPETPAPSPGVSSLPIPPPAPEPKPEEETGTYKKVPFMSAEYIGKYKIVCKLKNLQTGETCLGIVAKPTLDPSTSSTTAQALQPKVISTRPEPSKKKKLKKIPPIPGPPFNCPLEGCTTSFPKLQNCHWHYRRHMRRLERLQKAIESGEKRKSKKKKEKKEKEVKEKVSRRKGRKIQGSWREYICQVESCKYGFKHKESLDYHMKVYHAEIQCHFCPEKIPSLCKLIRHELDEHATESTQPGGYTCPRCGFVSISKQFHGLVQHYQNQHLTSISAPPRAPIKRLKCEDCPRTFGNQQKYLRHLQVFHRKSVELPVQCPDCPRKFVDEAGLRRHKLLSHSVNRHRRQVLTCYICSTVYTVRLHYDNHMKKHATNAIDEQGRRKVKSDPTSFLYSCDQCGKRFPLEGHLWNHQMEVHSNNDTGIKYICTAVDCGKEFQSRAGLVSHSRACEKVTVSGSPSSVPSICDFCGKEFNRLGCLKAHIRKVHESGGNQTAVCELCGKEFPSIIYLKRHMPRMHPLDADGNPGERTLPICQICGKQYPNKGLLRKHMNSKHESVQNE